MNNPSSLIDLSTAEFVADPYPTYHRLLEANAPHWYTHSGVTGGMWLFTRYEDVLALFKEARVSKNISVLLTPEIVTPLERSMLFRDPPDHTRLRALVHQTFTPARVRDLEGRIAQIVTELIERVRPEGSMDFLADFALPLPVIVIAELLGVPHSDRDRFRLWSNHIIQGVDMTRATEESGKRYGAAMQGLVEYFTALIAQRRAEPADDILSAMVAAQDSEANQKDRLTEEEILGAAILLLVAGHETTVNLLGNGLYTLFRHPDQLALLRTHPEHLPSAVEEMLRYESPVQRGTFRFVRESFTVGGMTIGANEQVSAVIGAANRDPDQFHDPDRFDITRDPNRHLAFGFGIHFCLGAALARAEARVGFAHLLAAFPTLQVDPSALATPPWQPSGFFRGLQTLPVVF